jgi:phosphonate transport system substrate-binding protein
MVRILWQYLLALSLAATAILPAWAADPYTFSVAPQFERRKLFGIWQPIVDELQRRTGSQFRLVTSLSVDEYERDVRKGKHDFAFANPYLVPQVIDGAGYHPLIRDQKPLRGILVVARDSPYRKVEDLQGKQLAVPTYAAMGASLLLRAELEKSHRVTVQVVDAKTHGSVFLHVINGLADAGGSVQKVLMEQPQAIQDALRVLHSTRGVPSHALVAHKRVPPALREKVKQAFFEMSESDEGRKLLAAIPMQKAVAASNEEYKSLLELGLERYLKQ